jgi:hypothetical protein
MLTDAGGANRVISQGHLARRFAFPVLLLHGEHNAVFDWRGSYDSLRLLKQAFIDPDGIPPEQPPAAGGFVLGADTQRRLHVFAGYGHQDCLIGRRAHADVFPVVVDFLDTFASPALGKDERSETLVADLPWMGPTLGWAELRPAHGELLCRLALRPSPARVSTRAVAFVPARRRDAGWSFDLDHATAFAVVDPEDLVARPVDVKLSLQDIGAHDGFVVLTLHDDVPRQALPRARMLLAAPPGLFIEPRRAPDADMRSAIARTLATAGDLVEQGIVRLDAAWVAAADRSGGAPAGAFTFALGSCQYPPGIVDREPAQESHLRLARRLSAATRPVPQMLLLLGDQIYSDATAGLFDPRLDGSRARSYELTFRLPAFREVTRALPTLMVLDDHEVYDGWEPARSPDDAAHAQDVAEALALYRRHQHKLAPDSRAEAPFRFQLRPAGFPLFVLDARSRRDARFLRGGGGRGRPLDEALIVPAPVMDELKAWLEACPKDAPKFIASPSVVLPLERRAVEGDEAQRLGIDSWSGYPASLVALLETIAQGRHEHVVFLSGDAHLSLACSMALTLPSGSAVTVHSIVSSGLYAPWAFANERPEDLLLEGAFAFRHRGAVAFDAAISTAAVGTAQGYCVVDVRRAGADGPWKLSVELDLAGESTICERVLSASEPAGAWRVRRFGASAAA